jgi:hypothetical protein
MMVVKSYRDAKAYLDLTEDEYAALRALGEKFSMQKIYYHTSLLSAALADMQRAGESKRSVAEIALTRMCEPKLMATAEALAVRLEQAEREIARMKISISAQGTIAAEEAPPAAPIAVAEELPAVPEPMAEAPVAEAPAAPAAAIEYPRWNRVIERIGELKRPLSAKFIGARVEQEGNAFTIIMKPFFAKSLIASADDVTLVKGAIAEVENIPMAKLVLNIKEKSDGAAVSFAGELESF